MARRIINMTTMDPTNPQPLFIEEWAERSYFNFTVMAKWNGYPQQDYTVRIVS